MGASEYILRYCRFRPFPSPLLTHSTLHYRSINFHVFFFFFLFVFFPHSTLYFPILQGVMVFPSGHDRQAWLHNRGGWLHWALSRKIPVVSTTFPFFHIRCMITKNIIAHCKLEFISVLVLIPTLSTLFVIPSSRVSYAAFRREPSPIFRFGLQFWDQATGGLRHSLIRGDRYTTLGFSFSPCMQESRHVMTISLFNVSFCHHVRSGGYEREYPPILEAGRHGDRARGVQAGHNSLLRDTHSRYEGRRLAKHTILAGRTKRLVGGLCETRNEPW